MEEKERSDAMLKLLEDFGDWMVWQVDNNDFLCGIILAFYIFFFCWAAGIINVGNNE